MTLCYMTNIWGHLQTEVCKEFAKLLVNDFRMIVYQPLDHEYSLDRIRMGWNLMPPKEYDWVIGPPTNEQELRNNPLYARWIEQSDVLVFSNFQLPLRDAIWKRIRAGKLTFKMGETIFKNPITWRDFLSYDFLRKCAGLHRFLNRPNVHFLTISHWCLSDLRFLHCCKGRIWRWGYLTKVCKTLPPARTGDKLKIGWCGRMLDWKKVDLLLRALSMLPVEKQSICDVTIVGQGPEEAVLKSLAETVVPGVVKFQPFLPHDEVISFMQTLDVYSFTSGRGEGWGAALVEAMNYGCVPIANASAGATLEIVRNGVTGFVFADDDAMGLAKHLLWCVEHLEDVRSMSRMAWSEIQRWSPELGANRFLLLVDSLMKHDVINVPKEGVCANVG